MRQEWEEQLGHKLKHYLATPLSRSPHVNPVEDRKVRVVGGVELENAQARWIAILRSAPIGAMGLWR